MSAHRDDGSPIDFDWGRDSLVTIGPQSEPWPCIEEELPEPFEFCAADDERGVAGQGEL